MSTADGERPAIENESNRYVGDKSVEWTKSDCPARVGDVHGLHRATAEKAADDWKEECEILYRVEEVPPFGLCILLGFQVTGFACDFL